MIDDIAYLSAGEAIAAFRADHLSPVELLEAVIARAAATEGTINAFMDTYFDEAREQARSAADAYAAGTARPLEGIPIAIKDEPQIEGRRWTQGSMLFEHEIAKGTDPITRRILDAGGIAHAHTTAPEFSMAIVTWSYLHGVTYCPWNPAMTSGGSSGGSGASLAAGSSVLATGSDIGGSIRIPAAMNGTIGFKPPWGRVPEFWPWNRDPYLSSGPMTRTVSDAILLQNVISGPLTGDLFSSPPVRIAGKQPAVSGMRIAMSTDLGYFAPDEQTVVALESAAERLRELGAVVDSVDLDWTNQAADTAITHLAFQSGAILRNAVSSPDDERLTPYIREFLNRRRVTVEEWIESWRYGDEMYASFQQNVLHRGYEALICPTLVTTSIAADLGHPDAGKAWDLGEMLDLTMTYPFNILGKLPVLNVPIGLDGGTGVPIGMQIVGPPDEDDAPFRIGLALEQAYGNWFTHHRPSLGEAG